MYQLIRILIAIVLLALATGSIAQGQFRYDVVALTLDVAPDGNGKFSSFEYPALNDTGQAVFRGRLFDTSGGSNDNQGIFRGNGVTELVQIARKRQALSDGTILSIGDVPLNNSGQVLLGGSLSDPNGGSSRIGGVFVYDDVEGLTLIAQIGQNAPNGSAVLTSVTYPTLNDVAQVAFRGFLSTGGNSGVFIGDGTSSLKQIIRANNSAPDGRGRFVAFEEPALNNIGQVAFFGRTIGSRTDGIDDIGIYLGDGTNNLSQLIRTGDLAPDRNGNVILDFDTNLVLNDVGQVAFYSSLTRTRGGDGDNVGVFRTDAAGDLVQIARAGQTAADSNGIFANFGDPTLNGVGQAALRVFLIDTNNGTKDDEGIYLGDGTSNIVQIAREGQSAPDGNGSFFRFDDPVVNDAGQVAFLGRHSGTLDGSRDDQALYIYDELSGLTQVVREGDGFLGSTITGLIFQNPDFLETKRSSFNERGQIAYRFFLADGRQGIAIATLVPEPSTLLLSLLASVTWLYRKRD